MLKIFIVFVFDYFRESFLPQKRAEQNKTEEVRKLCFRPHFNIPFCMNHCGK